MQLALFNENQLGVIVDGRVVDVTDIVGDHRNDPHSGWWRRLAGSWQQMASKVASARDDGRPSYELSAVRLRAPVLNPSKIIAAAANYVEHVADMAAVQERTIGGVDERLLAFDVFLKAPSSIIGPGAPIVLPADVVESGHEIHHECELVVVIGKGGKSIPESDALEHVFGYTIGLDITVRSKADRSRRKSYDTFSPIGPWIVTADEIEEVGNLDLALARNGELCEHVNTRDLIVSVPQLISVASQVMTLNAGDVIFTGAPAGVGPIEAGDLLEASLSGVGELSVTVES